MEHINLPLLSFVSFFLLIVAGIYGFAKFHQQQRELLPDEQDTPDVRHIEGSEGAMDEKIEIEFKRTSYPYRVAKIQLTREQKSQWDLLTISEKNGYLKKLDKLKEKGKLA